MKHACSPDLQQAIDLFFAEMLLRSNGPGFYRIGIEEIKREFRKKAMRFHPDRAALWGESRGRLEEKFKQINDAYALLKSEFADKHLILRSPAERSAPGRPRPGANGRTFNQSPPDSHARPESAPRRTSGPDASGESSSAFRPVQRKSFFFKGKLPLRRLRLGEFLFYNRVIPWHSLINAIVWQHRMRPRLGQIAVALDFLDAEDIWTILRNKRFKEPFGEAAVRLGFLTDYRRLVLLGHQRGYPFPLGRYFLDFNILDRATLARYLRENRQHNIHFPASFNSR
jgi:hypothetical protein